VSTTPSLTRRRLTTSTRTNNCNCPTEHDSVSFRTNTRPTTNHVLEPVAHTSTLYAYLGRSANTQESFEITDWSVHAVRFSQKLRQRINALVHLTRTQRSHPWLRSRAPTPRTQHDRASPGFHSGKATSPRWVASPHLKGWGSCRHVACDGAREAACCAPQRGRRALFGAVETIGVRVRAGRVVKRAKGAPSGGRGCV